MDTERSVINNDSACTGLHAKDHTIIRWCDAHGLYRRAFKNTTKCKDYYGSTPTNRAAGKPTMVTPSDMQPQSDTKLQANSTPITTGEREAKEAPRRKGQQASLPWSHQVTCNQVQHSWNQTSPNKFKNGAYYSIMLSSPRS